MRRTRGHEEGAWKRKRRRKMGMRKKKRSSSPITVRRETPTLMKKYDACASRWAYPLTRMRKEMASWRPPSLQMFHSHLRILCPQAGLLEKQASRLSRVMQVKWRTYHLRRARLQEKTRNLRPLHPVTRSQQRRFCHLQSLVAVCGVPQVAPRSREAASKATRVALELPPPLLRRPPIQWLPQKVELMTAQRPPAQQLQRKRRTQQMRQMNLRKAIRRRETSPESAKTAKMTRTERSGGKTGKKAKTRTGRRGRKEIETETGAINHVTEIETGTETETARRKIRRMVAQRMRLQTNL